MVSDDLTDELDAPRVESFHGLALNEAILFHGIPVDIVDRLLLQGLDPRRAGSNAGKMFGSGIYLADLSSKSDIYTTPNENGERCILCVRTCLGEAYKATARDETMTIPPERDDGRGPLNSVVALRRGAEGGAVEHREFIVYKEAQLLPQYAVWYRHRSTCECTHCGFVKFHVIDVWTDEQGHEGPFAMHKGETIGDMKQVIQQHLRIQVDDQALSFNGTMLMNPSYTIKSRNIVDESVIHVRRLRNEIFVRRTNTIQGPMITLVVPSGSHTITDVKELIARQAGIPPEAQYLMYNGESFDDDSASIVDYDITLGSTLDLELKDGWTQLLIDYGPRAGRAFHLYFSSQNLTIGNLKEKIRDARGFPVEEQCLSFNGVQFSDNTRTLSQSGMVSGSAIHLTFRNCVVVVATAAGEKVGLVFQRANHTIAYIKNRIKEVRGWPQEQQRLYHCNCRLEDNCRLSDCGITSGSTLILQLGL